MRRDTGARHITDDDLPHQKTPTKLLAEVFVPVEELSLSTRARDNTAEIVEAALRIPQVCRYWRKIAHGTSGLWNSSWHKPKPGWPRSGHIHYPSLEIYTVEVEEYVNLTGAVNTFLSSPHLRMFKLSIPLRRNNREPLAAFRVQWSQLTLLQLFSGPFSLNACCEILVQCINVVSVELHSREWTFPHATRTTQ
ncbi:hypothetical protein DFH07DRAFT_130858 [Mycena maculata]|uniref:F-box domain-containing protein n=1 Tax=Mycena maculata TaxID=230809 RepID=A0AAD7I406_9AGAR|nr:hypothetical protein DFH07DRAFT_130858 [Mycena maculata]